MVMNEKKKVFEEYHALKALMIMAVPAIISQLITLIYNIADTWFIGLTNNPNMVAACEGFFHYSTVKLPCIRRKSP